MPTYMLQVAQRLERGVRAPDYLHRPEVCQRHGCLKHSTSGTKSGCIQVHLRAYGHLS